jgi:hypothetical protein
MIDHKVSDLLGPLSASAPNAGDQPAATQDSRRRRLCLIAALAIVLANMAAVWLDARKSSYIPCVENCGESFPVLQYVRNFRDYGLRFGLIELLTNETHAPTADSMPVDRPLLYTHNLNLPGLLFVLLEALGVHSLAGKQVLTLVAHGLGLLYGYLAVRFLTRSALIALVFSCFFATDYEMVFGFALNPLRAWHWLALFGLVLHVALATNTERPAVHVAGVAVFATIAMGMGYEFFLICAVICILVVLLFGFGVPAPKRRGYTRAALVAAFFVPVALRQAQILWVLGFEYWRTDLYYSILTKVSVLRGFLPLPPSAEIERYYAMVGVYRPPTTSRSLGETASLTWELVRYVTLPAFGFMTLAVSVGVTSAGMVRRLRWRSFQAGREHAGLAIDAVFGLAVGSLLGMSVFADHNAVIFIKHKVPLIAAPLLLAKAVAVGLLIHACLAARTVSRRAVLASAVCLLTADHIAIQCFNLAATTPYRHTWIDWVRANPDATYGISWDPTAISAISGTKARAVSPRDELAIAQLAARDRGTPSAPRIVTPLLADLPEYWLYFPTDGMSPFDSFSPDCRLDYLSAALLDVLSPAHPAIEPGAWVHPLPAAPGGYVVFHGRIRERAFRNAQLVLRSTETSGIVTTNCRFGTFAGWIKTSANQGDGRYVISLRPRNRSYVQLKADLPYKLSAAAPPPDFGHPALLLQLPRPSIDEMRRRMASVPVANAGPTWVLFDLRGLKRYAALPDPMSANSADK